MEPFLKLVAKDYFNELGTSISNIRFIFPSRRAGLFFRKYLGELSEKPFFAPAITTINDFIIGLAAGYRKVLDKTELLFDLYSAYCECVDQPSSFDEFLYWGNIILDDFDEIDRYLINPKLLFNNLAEYKALDDDLSHLTQDQIDAIKSFWKNLSPRLKSVEYLNNNDGDEDYQENFIEFWEKLLPLYKTFNKILDVKNAAYEGKIYNELAHDEDILSRIKYKRNIFVGLFAFSRSEEVILRRLKKADCAEFCWDENALVLSDHKHTAKRILERNKNLLGQVKGSWISQCGEFDTAIKVVKCGGTIAQAKVLPSVLLQFLADQDIPEDDLLYTAIILPDEKLLMPVVSAIPPTYEKLNITMGYPLNRTPVAIFVDKWMRMVRSLKKFNNTFHYPADQVLDLLNMRLIADKSQDSSRLVRLIREQKSYFLILSELQAASADDPLLTLLFRKISSSEDLLSSLLEILYLLVNENSDDPKSREPGSVGNSMPEDEQLDNGLTAFDTEFIFHYASLVRRLIDLLNHYHMSPLTDTTVGLLEGLASRFTIPFEGEPLKGLQVMGMLETRALNFKNIIVLSAKEGVLPKLSVNSTLIPYTLRNGYSLPTGDIQDATAAYNFYRLLSNAENIYLLHDANGQGNGQGEESRYIRQLQFLYNKNVIDTTIKLNTYFPPAPIIRIKKTPEILASLHRFCIDRELAPSRLNTYVSCPLKFYYEAIENLFEAEAPEILMDAAEFGSVVHKAMQDIYMSFEDGGMITSDFISGLLTKGNTTINRTVTDAYKSEYLNRPDRKDIGGLGKLYCKMITRYVRAVLLYDMSLCPIRYIAGEKKFHGLIQMSDGKMLRTKGTIDRIDEINGTIRIVDYKTGKDDYKLRDWEMISMHPPKTKNQPKAIAQTLLYCELMLTGKENMTPENIKLNIKSPIKPCIYNLRDMIKQKELYNGYLSVPLSLGEKPEELDDYKHIRDIYLGEVQTILDEIFNPNIDFEQTDDTDYCAFCPFALSCGRVQ
ncbi:PD-(D/E)XK nuclease family protein [Porphyromonas pogonae]|uniref:PD-(D/E)XK nuclease family protein n=1 Tax=Porphyromonas pogonae TaxID=867595 RepID=UPI002E799F63|nr:PD-(D/E)XK nuclease family protein [Porphyromonas pogonae]